MVADTDPPALPVDWAVIRLIPLGDGIGGKVWRAERDDGSPAIVKSPSEAARPNARRAADYLRWRDGHGAIRLFDDHDGTHLLEYADETRLLDHRAGHGEAAAAEIAADVVRRLIPPRLPPGLQRSRRCARISPACSLDHQRPNSPNTPSSPNVC